MAASIVEVHRAVSSTTAASVSFVWGGARGGRTMTRWRPARSRRAKIGKTGVPVRTARSAIERDVLAGRPKNGTKTPSRRDAF